MDVYLVIASCESADVPVSLHADHEAARAAAEALTAVPDDVIQMLHVRPGRLLTPKVAVFRDGKLVDVVAFDQDRPDAAGDGGKGKE